MCIPLALAVICQGDSPHNRLGETPLRERPAASWISKTDKKVGHIIGYPGSVQLPPKPATVTVTPGGCYNAGRKLVNSPEVNLVLVDVSVS